MDNRVIRLAVVTVLLAAIGASPGPTPLSAEPARAEVPTAGVDTLRTGWDPAEPTITDAQVQGSDFGQLFATQLTGQIYAQPLVAGNTVLVSTEADMAYGLDASTGRVRWTRDLGPAWPASTIGCADLSPTIGSTATGTYDAATNTYYLTTKVNDGTDANHPTWYLHALDAGSGAERSGWPVPIVGTPANDPAHPFRARDVNERPGLLLLGGRVYMAFGSQCDVGSYVGWVAGVDVTTRQISLWSDESGASSVGGGIWHAGGGLASDGPGRIFLSTGNGVTTPDAPGGAPPKQLSESVVRLGVGAGGALSAQDFFTPADAAALDQSDQDLGAGGPVALPDRYFGTPSHPHLIVVIGKDGRLFLLDRDHLGGKAQRPGRGDDAVQVLGPYHGVWGHPAVFGGDGGYVYVVQNSAPMLAFKYGTDGSGRPSLALAGNTAESFGYSAGSPLVTSDGAASGSAVVWVVNVNGPTGAGGRLCAYHGLPAHGTLPLIRCFPIGTAAKFTQPASGAGRIYVGTRDGVLYGIGQPATPALSIPQTDAGTVAVGKSGPATIVATANRPVTVTAVDTGAPFAVSPPKLPVTVPAGGTLRVPVTFTPTDPGATTGVATVTLTDAGKTVRLGAALRATGVKPGFSATPPTVAFGDVAVGSSVALTASFTNTGTADEKISAVAGPTKPFTVRGLPVVGTVLSPGQSVSVSVTFAPTAKGAATSTVKVTGPHGAGTATLTANGVTGTRKLTVTPSSIAFGSVPVGGSATRSITVRNDGNLNVTITKAAPPALPFVVDTPLPEGQVLAPEESLTVAVTFAPTAAGTFSAPYTISSDDGAAAHAVTVTGTATAPAGDSLPSPAAGVWVANGSATLNPAGAALTDTGPGEAGSAVFSASVPSAGLTASFTSRITGGTGADGTTFALLDAASSTASSLGVGGGGLGFSGLAGVAVTLDTFRNGNDPAANFVGISTGGVQDSLTYVATTTQVSDLRTGAHAVSVTVAGGTVSVSVDGAAVLSAKVAVPANVRPAFTAGSGGYTDWHLVSNVKITSGAVALPDIGTGWRLGGTAAMNGASAVLTAAQPDQAGSLLYATPVRTDGLSASFTLTMGGGTGGDGATFALLDPGSGLTPGGPGGGLGFAGLRGVAVALSTYPGDRIALVTGATGGGVSTVATATTVPALRTGSHRVTVSIAGTVVTVAVDGAPAVSATVAALGATALVGWTAGTGQLVDVQAVADARIVVKKG